MVRKNQELSRILQIPPKKLEITFEGVKINFKGFEKCLDCKKLHFLMPIVTFIYYPCIEIDDRKLSAGGGSILNLFWISWEKLKNYFGDSRGFFQNLIFYFDATREL